MMVHFMKFMHKKYMAAFIGLVPCGFFLLLAYSSFHSPLKIQQSSFRPRLKFHQNQNAQMFLNSPHSRPEPMNEDDDVYMYQPKIDNRIHLMFIFFQKHGDDRLQTNLQQCLSSLFANTGGLYNADTDLNLVLHVFGDQSSFLSFQETIEKINLMKTRKPMVVYHDLKEFPEMTEGMRRINDGIGKVEHQFSHPYFYLSLFLHKLLPHNVSKLIMLDIDIVIKSDVSQLHALFDDFSNTNIIGIARENQPTYRNMFYEFRSENPKTRVGEPPPDGLTGFNSGVVLLDLAKMRNSLVYNTFLSNGTLARLAAKYHFQGNLGDQDAFTLISLEREDLFYILPCGWNRQLCRWWESADFEGIFDKYFACNETIHIFHGNCRTELTVGV